MEVDNPFERLQKLKQTDLYSKMKDLQRYDQFLEIQTEYIKDEQKNLKKGTEFIFPPQIRTECAG